MTICTDGVRRVIDMAEWAKVCALCGMTDTPLTQHRLGDVAGQVTRQANQVVSVCADCLD